MALGRWGRGGVMIGVANGLECQLWPRGKRTSWRPVVVELVATPTLHLWGFDIPSPQTYLCTVVYTLSCTNYPNNVCGIKTWNILVMRVREVYVQQLLAYSADDTCSTAALKASFFFLSWLQDGGHWLALYIFTCIFWSWCFNHVSVQRKFFSYHPLLVMIFYIHTWTSRKAQWHNSGSNKFYERMSLWSVWLFNVMRRPLLNMPEINVDSMTAQCIQIYH